MVIFSITLYYSISMLLNVEARPTPYNIRLLTYCFVAVQNQ